MQAGSDERKKENFSQFLVCVRKKIWHPEVFNFVHLIYFFVCMTERVREKSEHEETGRSG